MSQVPALRPFEITRDRRFDVLVGLPSLLDGIGFGILVAMHIETLCQSFTMACVPAVRKNVLPCGVPDLTPTQSQLVEMGNQLVSVSVKLCLLFIQQADISRLRILNGVCFGSIQMFSNSSALRCGVCRSILRPIRSALCQVHSSSPWHAHLTSPF